MSQVVTSPYRRPKIESGFNPGDPLRGRWWNQSDTKQGTTTLLMSIPKALVIDGEGKCRLVKGSRAQYTVPHSFDELEAIVGWLEQEGPAKTGLGMVGFDTADKLVSSFIIPGLTAEIRAQYPKFDGYDVTEWKASEYGSTGWNMVTNRFLGYLARVYDAGYGWWVNGHVRDKFGGGTRAVVQPRLAQGLQMDAEYLVGMIIATHENRSGTKTRTVQGVEVKIPDIKRTRRCTLYFEDFKQSGTLSPGGCNLDLPPSIVVPPTDGWDKGILPVLTKCLSGAKKGSTNDGS